ncbi:MAG: GntR family transcriptional regulator YhfZ [Erysipelotrichaceae bacterium]
MTKTNYQLFNKNASTIIYLSKLFMQMDIGSRVPTFEILSKKIGVARGTIQNSLKILQDDRVIEITPRGHMGTFLVNKDTKKLVQMADIRTLLGAMSLPYSKTYEGLATGIITSLHNKYDIPVNMAYMREALSRIDALLEGYYDFIIIGKSSALEAIERGQEIEIVIDFGEKTYLSGHLLIFSQPEYTKIEDGMRVGIAQDAIEQVRRAEEVCEGKNVEFVVMNYDEILPALKRKDVEVTIWNKDEINDALMQMYTVPTSSPKNVTSATLVVDKKRPELIQLFNEIIDIEVVKTIQEKVISGEIKPKY